MRTRDELAKEYAEKVHPHSTRDRHVSAIDFKAGWDAGVGPLRECYGPAGMKAVAQLIEERDEWMRKYQEAQEELAAVGVAIP